MGKLTLLHRPIVRRLDLGDRGLVVRITDEGIELRGYRRRRAALSVTWEQIASLSGAEALMLVEAEIQAGRRVIARATRSKKPRR